MMQNKLCCHTFHATNIRENRMAWTNWYANILCNIPNSNSTIALWHGRTYWPLHRHQCLLGLLQSACFTCIHLFLDRVDSPNARVNISSPLQTLYSIFKCKVCYILFDPFHSKVNNRRAHKGVNNIFYCLKQNTNRKGVKKIMTKTKCTQPAKYRNSTFILNLVYHSIMSLLALRITILHSILNVHFCRMNSWIDFTIQISHIDNNMSDFTIILIRN